MSKNYKGGYKIISLLGISLVADESVTIAGIHKAIEASYRKPLLIEGIVIDGVEKDATWVKELKVVDGSFVIEIYGMKLTITDEDEVEVEESKEITETVIELDEPLPVDSSEIVTLLENVAVMWNFDLGDYEFDLSLKEKIKGNILSIVTNHNKIITLSQVFVGTDGLIGGGYAAIPDDEITENTSIVKFIVR